MVEALQRDFMVDFKRVFKEKGQYDLKAQIPYLSQLADRYKRLGEKDQKEQWTDLLKAHTLYNSCAVRSDVKDRERWMQASYDVQKLFWGQEVKATKKDVESVATTIKVRLETLRTELSQKLEPIGKEIETWHYSFESLESSPDAPEIPFQLCETIQHLSTLCNDSMIDIVHSVIGEAVKTCGEPPCDFSAIAFGSLAKGEATPYSDLEYLFLIEDESPDNISYFEKLAMNSYFIVGNVQETNLKYMSIDELRQDKWFVDKAMSGLKIDGLSENAGNIPTGNNRPGTKKNKLILTPSELAKEYKDLLDNPASDQKQPGDLTDMLTYTKEFYNHNNNNLLEKFRKTIAQYLPNEKRQTASRHMLQQDIKAYDFVPNIRHMFASTCVNLKTDIYRYPSIVIYDLKINFSIESRNTWDTLNALLDRSIISQEMYDCLLFLICVAQYIRFSAYLCKNSQEDSLSLLLKNTDTDTSVTDKSLWHLPRALFFRICLTMLPVKTHITLNIMKENGLREPVTFNKYEAANVFYKTLPDYQAVIQCIKKRYPSFSNMDISTKHDLAVALSCVGSECAPSLIIWDEILDQVKNNATAPEIQAFVISGFGTSNNAISCITVMKAHKLHRDGKNKEALAILGSIEKLSIDADFRRLLHIHQGIIYAREIKSSLAEQYFKLADDQASTDEPSENTNINKLAQYLELGALYLSTGNFHKAEGSAMKALSLSQQLYGPGYEPVSGQIYHQLGAISLIWKKNFTQAEKYLCLAKRNSETSTIINGVDITSAELMIAQGDYRNALRTFRKLLRDKQLSTTSDVINYADINSGIAKCFMSTGAWPAAELSLYRAKDLYIELSRKFSRMRVDILEIDYYIAQCLFHKGQTKEAMIALRQNIEDNICIIQQTSCRPELPSDIDTTLVAIVNKLKEEGEFVGPYKLSASSCFSGLCMINDMLRNDEPVGRYYNVALTLM